MMFTCINCFNTPSRGQWFWHLLHNRVKILFFFYYYFRRYGYNKNSNEISLKLSKKLQRKLVFSSHFTWHWSISNWINGAFCCKLKKKKTWWNICIWNKIKYFSLSYAQLYPTSIIYCKIKHPSQEMSNKYKHYHFIHLPLTIHPRYKVFCRINLNIDKKFI